MKAIIKNVIIMVFVGALAGTTSVAYAQQEVTPVKTVAPDPSNTLNTGKPIVSFNIFDTNSYKNIFDKNDEEDENLKYNGRLAYNTSNVIRTTSVRYDYDKVDRVNDEQGYIIGKDGVRKIRGTRVNNGVASVGSAGVVLARDGQVNYGVLVLFILMLIAVIVLARLTIRKKNNLTMYQPPYTRPVAPRYPATMPPAGYQAYHPDPRYRQ